MSGDVPTSSDTTAATETEVDFIWKIPEYSKQSISPGQDIQSADFSFKGPLTTSFYIKFYAKSINKVKNKVPLSEAIEIRKSVSIFLLSRNNFHNQEYHVELSILGANGKQAFGRIFHADNSSLDKGYGNNRFILQSVLENPANGYLPNDTLSIYCHVKKLKSTSTTCRCPRENLSNVRRLRQFSQDIAALLNDETTADFNFKVKNCVIAAHKTILGARSPVFAAMFKHGMKEKEANEVEIEDMEPGVFRKMLQFIYTNDCDVGEDAEELLIAADRYDVKDLKEICEEELKSNLTLDNALRLFLLSDAHNAAKLRRNAILFIKRNKRDVVKQPEWNDSRLHPSLTTALLTHKTS